MSARTARTYERRGRLPSQLKHPRMDRSRPNPFAEDWLWIYRAARGFHVVSDKPSQSLFAVRAPFLTWTAAFVCTLEVPMPTTLYRIIRSSLPSALDFRSHMAKCEPLRGAEIIDPSLWTGLSTFIRPDQAARLARRYSLGTHLVRLEIPDDDPRVVFKATLGVGHITVWACEDLFQWNFVKEITPLS
jgi:hypothetical protein